MSALDFGSFFSGSGSSGGGSGSGGTGAATVAALYWLAGIGAPNVDTSGDEPTYTDPVTDTVYELSLGYKYLDIATGTPYQFDDTENDWDVLAPFGGGGLLFDDSNPTTGDGYDGAKWLNTSTGSIFTRVAGVWSQTSSLVGPAGPTGPANGREFRSFIGAPDDGVGNNGDTGLDRGTGNLYVKAEGTWTATGQSILGAEGPEGASAYQVWLDAGNIGTVAQFLDDIKGEQGDPGSPGGFSFRAGNGAPNDSLGIDGDHYANRDDRGRVFVKAAGTWLDTGDFVGANQLIPGNGTPTAAIGLVGDLYIDIDDGSRLFQKVTATAWVDLQRSLGGTGPAGQSVYELAVENGFVGTESAYLASLSGEAGQSAYDLAVSSGFVGTETEWLDSITGAQGESAYETHVRVVTDAGGTPHATEAAWLASLKGDQGDAGDSAVEKSIWADEYGLQPSGAGAPVDNTAPIKAAIEGLRRGERLVFHPHPVTGETQFFVDELLIDSTENIYCEYEMLEGCSLVGIATQARDAVLRLWGQSKQKWTGWTIETDGSALSPVHVGNYECLRRTHSKVIADGDAANIPSQFLQFSGGQLRHHPVGDVFGNHADEPAQSKIAQSEIRISGLTHRGVETPLIQNAQSGFITADAVEFIAQQFEASASWWDNSRGALIKNLVGEISVASGELQRAIAEGHQLYGQGITISAGVIMEGSAPIHMIDGRPIVIDSNISGYMGNTDNHFITVQPGCTNYMRLSGVRITKGTSASAGPGGIDGAIWYAPEAPDAHLFVDHVTAEDMNFDNDDYLFVGGQVVITQMSIKDDDPANSSIDSFQPRGDVFDRELATPNGASMGNAADATAKGGWSKTTGADADTVFYGVTAGVPDEIAAAIRFEANGPGVSIATPKMRLGGKRNYLVPVWIKVNDPNIDIFRLQVNWSDHAQTTFGQNTIMAVSPTLVTAHGLSNWRRILVPFRAPRIAEFFQVIANGPGTYVNGANVEFAIDEVA